MLRFGPRPKYIGMAVLIAAWGIFMGMRHAGMHAARDIGQGFSLEIFGAHTYTWALITYWTCVLVMGALLLLVRSEQLHAEPRTLRGIERLAGGAFLVVVAANVVQAFASTGPPPFMGQSDPIRFSFNPAHWHWSLEEWQPATISLRGRWNVRKPDLAAVPGNPADGPLANLPTLTVTEQRPLRLALDGSPTDLAYDAATDQFLLTTTKGVYLTDGALEQVQRHAIIDAGYSVDIGRIAGAAIADGRLFALSAAYGTLLTIDLATHQVAAAQAIPGLTRPTGLAITGGDLYIVDDAGRLTVVASHPKP